MKTLSSLPTIILIIIIIAILTLSIIIVLHLPKILAALGNAIKNATSNNIIIRFRNLLIQIGGTEKSSSEFENNNVNKGNKQNHD